MTFYGTVVDEDGNKVNHIQVILLKGIRHRERIYYQQIATQYTSNGQYRFEIQSNLDEHYKVLVLK